MSKITYRTDEAHPSRLRVELDGKFVGTIKFDGRGSLPGYRYYPNATGRSGRPGPAFLTIAAVKQSIEG